MICLLCGCGVKRNPTPYIEVYPPDKAEAPVEQAEAPTEEHKR